ncbi:MAB_1171c family putative transporter [Streptomyces sp. 12297]|uniref:MAB_1171c family putative transporter n=1 Tax=Streptomyces sp. NBC_00239 TaxID=2903640 RepID=UPI002E2C5FEE|nr:MAB_1171c family putative transporter [Streptomyces sp. NBC_00239]
MNSLLYPICSAVALFAMVYKARVLTTDRSVTQLALVANFLLLFVIFTVSTPSVWPTVSDLVGITNFSGLLTQSCVIVMTACQQLVLLHLMYGARAARRKAVPRVLALALVLAAMAVLFAGAATHGEAPDDFAVARAQYTPAYLAVYLAAFTANQVEIGVMGWRYSRIAPSPWLRRGLRMVALTLPFALVYTCCRTADIIAAQLGGTGHRWEPIAQLGVGVAVIVQTVGWILPDWGPHLTAGADRLRNRRAYRTLTPLHRVLTEAVPEPVIPVSSALDLPTRLYRMLIEIRDAQWALRTWMDPEIARTAETRARQAGLRDEELAAVVEAAQLHGAIEAKRTDRPPERPLDTPVATAPGDLAAELAFQQRLAKAMASPVALEAAGRTPATPASSARTTKESA